jgi:magnesium transporter
MKRVVHRRIKKSGLPPESLVHIGPARTDAVVVRMLESSQGALQAIPCESIDSALGPLPAGEMRWIDMDGVHSPEIVRRLGSRFDIHPLTLEDILNTEQRVKIDEYESYIFIVVKLLRFDAATETVNHEQIAILLGENYVVTFQENAADDLFEVTRGKLQACSPKFRRITPDIVAYLVLDTVVDRYFDALERVGETMDELEDQLSESPRPEHLRRVNHLKKTLMYMRKWIWPLRELVAQLQRGLTPLIRDSLAPYMRDVQDHVVHSLETVESYRDMATSLQDLYLSSLSHRTNEIMRVLTVISTIFMPLTFIAGVYGMNFKHMPELQYWWAYPATLAGMAAIGVGMWMYSKSRRWL